MALKQTFTLVTNFNTEVVFQNCYVKVLTVEGNKAKVKSTYGIFASEGGNLLQTNTAEFDHDISGPNFIKQAYTHLKTLTVFEGATDC